MFYMLSLALANAQDHCFSMDLTTQHVNFNAVTADTPPKTDATTGDSGLIPSDFKLGFSHG